MVAFLFSFLNDSDTSITGSRSRNQSSAELDDPVSPKEKAKGMSRKNERSPAVSVVDVSMKSLSTALSEKI